MLNQLSRVESLKIELLELTTLGVPRLRKANGSLVSKVEFLEEIQKIIKKIDDIYSLLASFDEVHLLKFFNSWANGGVQLQQCL